MGFLQGSSTPAASHPIFAFWTWWSEGGMDELTHAVSTGEYGDLPDRIAKLTGAIDPNLAWELGADAPYLAQLVPDVAERDVFLCGAPQWMDAARRAALDCGVPAEHIHLELFEY